MNIEKKYIEAWHTGKNLIGHITLDKLAIPETVKVNLIGKEITPISFDCYGHPNFSEEQYNLYIFNQEQLKREFGKYIALEVEISYEEYKFDISRNLFDSVEGIKKSLTNISKLSQTLANRKRFLKVFKDENLREYMFWGCFLLDKTGNIQSLTISEQSSQISYKDIERFDTFKKKNSNFEYTLSHFTLPKEDSICTCCGKPITIDDIKNSPSIYEAGKYYHSSCYYDYTMLLAIDKLTRQLMDKVYNYSNYTFKLCPNVNADFSILFNTIDGDIIITINNRFFSIEWQENYVSFDVNELFSEEETFIWNRNGKQVIRAWNNEKAIQYLTTVYNAISKR